jgi:coatomer subunit beta'
MDPSGKLIYTRNHDVSLETSKLFPTPLPSHPFGSQMASASPSQPKKSALLFIATSSPVGDGEIGRIHHLHWRNKSFGNGISFAWAPDSNTYAILESKVKLNDIYKNFRERPGTGMKGSGSWPMESLHGGTLLGVRDTVQFVMF